jgi:hypothetical protein
MTSISVPASTPPTQSAPRVVQGLAYGMMASLMMWAAIAAVAYEIL